MFRTVLPALVIASTLAAASASAQTPAYDSWYVGLDLVAGFGRDTDVNGAAAGSIAYDAAVGIGGLKVGYRPQALSTERGAARFELELAGRVLALDTVTSGGRTTDGKGDLAIGALMANAYYDLHTGTAFTPYVGGGIGLAGVAFSDNPGFGITDKDAKDTRFAAQVSVGVAYAPDWLPGTSWSLGYNYFHVGAPEFAAGSRTVKLDALGVSSVQLGFKYHF